MKKFVTYVWVVEVKFEGNSRFVPCSECAINKRDAAEKKWEWKRKNPDDTFRIKKYIRLGGEG